MCFIISIFLLFTLVITQNVFLKITISVYNKTERGMCMFARRIKELRESLKMSQIDFGDIFGLSASAIGMYEQDRRHPDSETLSKFADYFNVSVDYLLGRTEFPNVNVYDKEKLTKELMELGINEMGLLKDLKLSDLTIEELKELAELSAKILKRKQKAT